MASAEREGLAASGVRAVLVGLVASAELEELVASGVRAVLVASAVQAVLGASVVRVALAGPGELAAPAGQAAAGKPPIVRPRVQRADLAAAVPPEGRA